MSDSPRQRTEHDSHGAVSVPAEAYWGAQTARARQNFPTGDRGFPPAMIHALGLVKQAAARANTALGVLDADLSALVAAAAHEVAAGKLDAHITVPVWQSGSGTQLNMNVNEVIAGRANEQAGRGRGGRQPVHPNDHVNRSQSSNDVIPTALQVAALRLVDTRLLPALATLDRTLAGHATAFAEVVKIGRTHLMDALPVTVGQEFTAWRTVVARGRRRIEASRDELAPVPLGGTAVGTGLGAPAGFAMRAVAELAELAEVPLTTAESALALQASHPGPLALSSALRDLSVGLHRMADDIRLLASGPRCGLGELKLPVNEPGSSAMPGKVNPTQAESLIMICLQVQGADMACALAAGSGYLELNTARPLLAVNLLPSITLLAEGIASFEARCLRGLEVDRERVAELRDRSLMLVTALVQHLGYDRAAAIAQRAHREGTSLREAALADGALDAETFDRLVVPADLI